LKIRLLPVELLALGVVALLALAVAGGIGVGAYIVVIHSCS
jgi:hypothetical protein